VTMLQGWRNGLALHGSDLKGREGKEREGGNVFRLRPPGFSSVQKMHLCPAAAGG